MAHEEVPSHALTDTEVAERIHARFPSLATLRVTRLGEGMDHRAFDVGGRYVFRVPKHREAAEHLTWESRLLDWLAPRLALAVPVYRFLAQADAGFPWALMGYEKLPGTPALLVASDPLDLPGIGLRLGHFLRALHALAPDDAAALGVREDNDPTLEAWSAAAVEDLRLAREYGLIEAHRAEDWEPRLMARPMEGRGAPRLVHGDFAAEHVLLDAHGAPTGVIDWSDAHLGDPALDFAGLLHWGGAPMLSAALEAYGVVSRAVLTRARWFAACRAVADIAFGQTNGRPEYTAAGQRALIGLE
ncbi:phosphotransferase family protein [Myxococcus sp. Y35]|uniref:phosphotransferase family protein n=1 Tax=Pseudomyxococcus flavus TaxID=3115648 RepID=UPI003CEDB963